MTTDHCLQCGRPVTPCANCGDTYGLMIRVSATSARWVHSDPRDCIVSLQAALDALRAELDALKAAQEAMPEPQL